MSSMAARMGAIKHLSRGQSFDVRMRYFPSRALRLPQAVSVDTIPFAPVGCCCASADTSTQKTPSEVPVACAKTPDLVAVPCAALRVCSRRSAHDPTACVRADGGRRRGVAMRG